MRKMLLLTALIVTTHFCLAQTDTERIKKSILQSADSMATAFKARDWKTIIHFSPQSVLDMSGGAESLIEMTESVMNQIPADAIKYFAIGPVVQVVKTENDWQCIVEQHMTMEINGMRITMMTPLIGQSLNNGASWTFFDSKGDDETARTILPGLSSEIILPKSKQDVVQLYTPPVIKGNKETAKPEVKKTTVKKPVAVKKN
jgi:hypothetical protein